MAAAAADPRAAADPAHRAPVGWPVAAAEDRQQTTAQLKALVEKL